MRVAISLLTVGLAAGLVLADFAAARQGDKKPPEEFKIVSRKADDTVEVQSTKDKAVFAVKSPSGISELAVERLGEQWPKTVVVKLHLKGLEHFRATGDKVRLDGSVGIQNGKARVRLWKDGKEDAVLDEKSPYWMDIRVIGADGKPAAALPVKDGYFELPLPAALFEGNPKVIAVQWIDFYR